MDARSVDPREVSWEEDRPAYRVSFWSPARDSPAGGTGWASDEWRLTGAGGVGEVFNWAAAHDRGRRFELLVEVGRPPQLGVVRLAGLDPTGVRVRQADPDESDEVATVWLRARAASVPSIPPPVHGEEEVRAWFREVVFPDSGVFVAEFAERVVGLLVLGEGSVDQLYVEPTSTNWRIGTLLVGVAKARWPGGLELWTFEANTGARRFYERHGFRPVEWASDHSEENAPDVRYRWPGYPSTP